MTTRLLSLAALLPALLPAQGSQKMEDREFPANAYWHRDATQWSKHAPLIGKPMPALDLSEWRNADSKLVDSFAGKVVVIDFWATWCGPCIASIPHNKELIGKYGKQGMVFLAICGSNRGQEKMDDVLKSKAVDYPVARDAKEATARAFAVQWWPTYAVFDRAGNMRAIGLKPDAVDQVVEKLLAEPAPGGKTGTEAKDGKGDDGGKGGKEGGTGTAGKPAVIAAEWLESNPKRATLLTEITDKPAPALQVTEWVNAEPGTLERYRGKVVMLDFWATWCGPCIASIPKNNELARKYADQGLVVLGICHPKDGDKMAQTMKAKGMEYPSALDADGKTIEAYGVNSYPDYYFLDRNGVLRIADCSNGAIEAAIQALLAEPVK